VVAGLPVPVETSKKGPGLPTGPGLRAWGGQPLARELELGLRGLLELRGGTRCPPALTEGAHSCSLLQAPSLAQRSSFPKSPLLWQLVPDAGEEWSRGCDRDGQVVEARAEWGVGERGHSVQPVWASFRALAPSGGSLVHTWDRQLGSRLVSACRRATLDERVLFSES